MEEEEANQPAGTAHFLFCDVKLTVFLPLKTKCVISGTFQEGNYGRCCNFDTLSLSVVTFQRLFFLLSFQFEV